MLKPLSLSGGLRAVEARVEGFISSFGADSDPVRILLDAFIQIVMVLAVKLGRRKEIEHGLEYGMRALALEE